MIAPSLIESNLSATVFALDALKTAGELDADIAKATAVFVRRCQNAKLRGLLGPQPPWLWLLDGGFHFVYDDPTRNKAGLGKPTLGIFHSYGSTTDDGLRALHYCAQPDDDERQKEAADWLVTNFRADTHPGNYVAAHEPNREAVYYYCAASVSQAFRDHKLTLPDNRQWAKELSTELVTRQKKDGSWVNPVELVRENDPVVATCNAVSALTRCK